MHELINMQRDLALILASVHFLSVLVSVCNSLPNSVIICMCSAYMQWNRIWNCYDGPEEELVVSTNKKNLQNCSASMLDPILLDIEGTPTFFVSVFDTKFHASWNSPHCVPFTIAL